MNSRPLTLILSLSLLLSTLTPSFSQAQSASGGVADAASTPRDQDLSFLLNGVQEIAAPGLPGPLSVFGPNAFPVVVGGSGEGLRLPVVAASRSGRGRVVTFGHTGYLEREALETADTGKLILNAVKWVAQGRHAAGSQPVRVGVLQQPDLLNFLLKQGVQAETLTGVGRFKNLNSYDVLCCLPSALTDAEIAQMGPFLRRGGGAILADLGWGWLELNPGKSLNRHGGNRLLQMAGILWADGGLERTSAKGFATTDRPSPLCQASDALDAVVAATTQSPVEAAQSIWTVSVAARTLAPTDTLLLPRLKALQRQHQGDLDVSLSQPMGLKAPLGRLLLTMQIEEAENAPAAQVRAHPSARNFPGSVPASAPRIRRDIDIDTTIPDWHSTGLYAAPGDPIEVEAPDILNGKGLRVRIGAHTDTLWDQKQWDRAPEITRSFELKSPSTLAANAFGGPIYIEVPENCKLGVVHLSLRNAVEAPYFVRGKTDPVEWREKIRLYPAPWAELQANSVILTVPSRVIRDLDDPESLLALWDIILDNVADLAAIPHHRARPERYVTDRQISAGYMHSGYPIMTGLDVAEAFVSRQKILTNGHPGVWGFFHEMGHNHQQEDWTFEGTGEVTNNLFPLYVLEKVCGMTQNQHPALTQQAMRDRLQKYIAGGARFARWKDDPFLALTMYIELQQAFGWDTYKRVFAEYRGLPDAQRPKTDDEKRDQWLTRFSRAAGKNLGPFFQAWGVPTSEQARQSIADLPTWMPDDFPNSVASRE